MELSDEDLREEAIGKKKSPRAAGSGKKVRAGMKMLKIKFLPPLLFLLPSKRYSEVGLFIWAKCVAR